MHSENVARVHIDFPGYLVLQSLQDRNPGVCSTTRMKQALARQTNYRDMCSCFLSGHAGSASYCIGRAQSACKTPVENERPTQPDAGSKRAAPTLPANAVGCESELSRAIRQDRGTLTALMNYSTIGIYAILPDVTINTTMSQGISHQHEIDHAHSHSPSSSDVQPHSQLSIHPIAPDAPLMRSIQRSIMLRSQTPLPSPELYTSHHPSPSPRDPPVPHPLP